MVIYQDGDVLVCNKPAGTTVIPEAHDEAPCLLELLATDYGRLFTVHRIDKETSGLVIFARTEAAHRTLSLAFSSREIHKEYLVLVLGSPGWDQEVCSVPLLPDGDRRHRTLADPGRGKPSLTRFRVLERFPRYSLLAASPETGRTHQIRVHAALLGHRVLCDPLYGDGRPLFLSAIKRGYRPSGGTERPLLARLGLHAASVELLHPASGLPVRWEAPPPKDLAATLRQLRNAC